MAIFTFSTESKISGLLIIGGNMMNDKDIDKEVKRNERLAVIIMAVLGILTLAVIVVMLVMEVIG